jgi:DNA-binding transcriptional LysR family regulator
LENDRVKFVQYLKPKLVIGSGYETTGDAMTLRQLEMFNAIVETGRFTGAAERLYVAQPSVSQQINLLEDELGAKLFLRLKNRKLIVTEAGRIFKGHAEMILRQCQVARVEISSLTESPSGTIRVGLGGHQLTSMLPPALVSFHARFPKICVDIVNATTPQLLQMLKLRQLDLAVVNFPVQSRELRSLLLFTEEMVLIVPKTHPLAEKHSIGPAELSNIPLVLYDQSTSTRPRLDSFFRENQIVPQIILELSSVGAMKHMVEAGLGAAIIPESALLPISAKVSRLRITGKQLTRSVGLATPIQQNLPSVVGVMIDLLKERFHEIERSLAGTKNGRKFGARPLKAIRK